jgi:hypothetical protein
MGYIKKKIFFNERKKFALANIFCDIETVWEFLFLNTSQLVALKGLKIIRQTFITKSPANPMTHVGIMAANFCR